MNRDASPADRRWMELMGAMRDGVIAPAEIAELEGRIASDPKAADQYLRFMTLHALLLRRQPAAAAEARPLKFHRPLYRRWLPISIAAGLMILLAGWLGSEQWSVGNYAYAHEELSIKLEANQNWVAALSLVEHGKLFTQNDRHDETMTLPVKPGKGLDRRRFYEVKSGWVLVNFYDGAELILKDHAAIYPIDTHTADFIQGQMNVRVLSPARPFIVNSDDLQIVVRGQALVRREPNGSVLVAFFKQDDGEILMGDRKLPFGPDQGRAVNITSDGVITPLDIRDSEFAAEWVEVMSKSIGPAAPTGRVTAVTFPLERLLAYDDQDGLFNKGTRMEVLDGGATLRLTGNCWKRLPFKRTIHPETVLEFDFRSGSQGELHGIGLDTDNSHRTGRTLFQLHGIDALWCGIYAYRDYSGGDWAHYRIPVGRFYTGEMSDLVFWADDDEHGAAESLFRNVVIRD